VSSRFLRWYGSDPLHLVALLLSFAVAGYAAQRMLAFDATAVVTWFAAAVIGHDLVLLPLYTLADRPLTGLARRRVPATSARYLNLRPGAGCALAPAAAGLVPADPPAARCLPTDHRPVDRALPRAVAAGQRRPLRGVRRHPRAQAPTGPLRAGFGSEDSHMTPRPALGSGLVILAGAGVYALLQGVAGADFTITPLTLGLIGIAAGVAGARRRVVATGVVLAGWGVAVLLVAHDVVPAERTAPAYMLGIAAGLLVAGALAGAERRGQWLTSGAIPAFAGPLGLYLAYDLAAVGRWPLWALILVAWAGYELFWGLRQAHPATATPGVTGRAHELQESRPLARCPARTRWSPRADRAAHAGAHFREKRQPPVIPLR
jgi:hypothetical protein